MEEKEYISAYASVNSIQMYYEIHGEGNALVLIHGGGSTIQTSFGKILPLFAEKYQVIAVELQAHGRTADRDTPESFDQDAEDVIALLHHLGIKKAYILGFSNGGNTAMKIAMKAPEIVNKLIIISAFYKREGMIPDFFEAMEHATLNDMPQLLKEGYLAVNNSQEGLLAMFTKDRDRMRNFRDWTDDDLRSIHTPAFIIAGQHDVVTVEHTVQMSHMIPDAELMILPGTHGSFIGEVISYTEGSIYPEITVKAITEFLEKS